MSNLTLQFVEERHVVSPGGRFTFGRIADLEIDSNRYLHRVVGAFEWVEGAWWLVNTGSAIVLELSDVNSASRISVAPGSSAHLSFPSARLSFQAGRSRYEIGVEQTTGSGPEALADDLTGDETITGTSVSLNVEQRRLLAGLARKRIVDPSLPTTALTTNREVADSLGWTKTKFDRKLDHLCVIFAELGVPDLVASPGRMARRRREGLVDYVLLVELITADDLADYEAETVRLAEGGAE